jgi:hypothetical protein
VDYAREAAQDTRSRLAYEESALHLRRALEVLDLGAPGDALRLAITLGE